MSLEVYHATDPSTITRMNDRISELDELNYLYSSEKSFDLDTLIGKRRMFDSGGYSYKIGKDIDFNQVLDNHIELAERSSDIVVPHDRSYHRPDEINTNFIKDNLELVDTWGNYGFDNMMYAIHARNRDDIIRQLDHVTSQNYYDVDYVGIASSEVNVNDRRWHNREVAYSLINMAKTINEVKEEYNIRDMHFFAVGGSYTIPIALLLGSNTIDSATPEHRASRGIVYVPVRKALEYDLDKLNYYVGSPWGKKNENKLLAKRQNDIKTISEIDSHRINLADLISNNDPGTTDPNYIQRVYFNCLSTLDDIDFWSSMIKENNDIELKKIINEFPRRSIGNYRSLLLDCINYIDHVDSYGNRYEWYLDQRTSQIDLSRWF